jgi:hypothetical protein
MLDLLHSTELMARVFTHLSPQQALRAGETCKAWHVASLDANLWQAQAEQTFSTMAPPRQEALVAFSSRWAASRSTLDGLLKPRTRALSTQQLARDTAPMANPHRAQVSDYILDRVASGIPMRLDAHSVTAGIERAMSCAHISDEARVAARGATLQACYSARVLADMSPRKR